MVQFPRVIYGAHPLSLLPKKEVLELISLLRENGDTKWDPARIYPNNEKNTRRADSFSWCGHRHQGKIL